MKLKTALITLFLLTSFIMSSNNTFAVFCCGDGTILDSKQCYDTGNQPCQGTDQLGNRYTLRSCSPDNTKTENGITFNSDCYINIQAPEQVKITDFGRLFSGAVSFLLLVAFILAFFYLILGGIAWLTSGGDKANIEGARNKIIAAIIGLIIVAATWAIFQLVGGAIGFNILGGFTLPTLY